MKYRIVKEWDILLGKELYWPQYKKFLFWHRIIAFPTECEKGNRSAFLCISGYIYVWDFQGAMEVIKEHKNLLIIAAEYNKKEKQQNKKAKQALKQSKKKSKREIWNID